MAYIYRHKAQYYETDQMGIIHHSNYIRWFEEARTSYLDDVGFAYKKMEELGLLSPVISVECEYKSMVHYADIVNIALEITQFNGIKYTVEYVVTDNETGVIRATGRTKHCFLNREGNPVSVKKNYPEIYELMSVENDK